jgi:hypothetical protein
MGKKMTGLIIVLAMIGFSCGYRFTGGGELPAGVKTVFVKIFKNRTTEVGVENTVTSLLINEFTQYHQEQLAVDIQSADAILTGEITGFKFKTITHSGTYSARERRVRIIVRVEIQDHDGKVLWVRILTQSSEYDVTSDKTVTEQNRKNAIQVASARLAEDIYNRLTEGF